MALPYKPCPNPSLRLDFWICPGVTGERVALSQITVRKWPQLTVYSASLGKQLNICELWFPHLLIWNPVHLELSKNMCERGPGWVTPRMGALRRGSWLLQVMLSFRIHRPLTVQYGSSCLHSVPSVTPFPPDPKYTTPASPIPPAQPHSTVIELSYSLSKLHEPACSPPYLCSHCSPRPHQDAVPSGLSHIFLILQDPDKVASPWSLPWFLQLLLPFGPGGLWPNIPIM